jgi:iron complex transport system substrate-binding protein
MPGYRSKQDVFRYAFIFVVFFGCLLPVPAGASTENNSTVRHVIDLTGRNVEIPALPKRVISLAPAITEMIFSLGKQEVLLATVEYSNHPPQAGDLPRVGSYIRPDLEKIVAFQPDLVLATRDGNPRHVIDQLDRLSIPVFAIDPRNLEHIQKSLLALGRVFEATPRAEAIASSMARRLALIDEHVKLVTYRPRVFFQVDAEPIVSIGEDTFLHEMITRAGGRNVATGSTPYPRFNWEQLLSLQPEIVIITSMSGGRQPEWLRQQWQRWPQIEAVRNDRIHVVDADLFDRPTQRLVDGLETLTRYLHPQLFAPGRYDQKISIDSPGEL